MSAVAAGIAARARDAYSAWRYRSWETVASMLLRHGFSEREAEAIMRSKIARWAADASGKDSYVPSSAIIKYIDDPKNKVTQKYVDQLVAETFPEELEKAKVENEAQAEIERLKSLISRAQRESKLVERDGQPMLLVPYWFIKAK